LEYDEDNNNFDAAAVYSHPNQIWAMEPSPQDMGLVFTSGLAINGFKSVVLWRMPRQSESEIDVENGSRNTQYDREPLELEKVCSLNLKEPNSFVHSIKWHPVRDSVLTADHKHLISWSIGESNAQVTT